MKRMLVGLDGSDRAPEIVHRAVQMAEGLGARLILFRVVGSQLLLARRQLAILADAVPGTRLEDVCSEVGIPWEALCASARRLEVDAIVIGSHGYGDATRPLGTTAEKVIQHADRDVLIVRAPAAQRASVPEFRALS